MESLNEVMPKKHTIRREGKVVAETEDVNEAQNQWSPSLHEHWIWERDGEVVMESTPGTLESFSKL